MVLRLAGAALALVAACGSADEAAPPAEPAMESVAVSGDPTCQPMDRIPLEGRPSPYDSVVVNIGGEYAKLCYGRPSTRGREVFGGTLVPYDTLWRTGANEPTTIHLPFAAEIAGLRVEPGSYTIYTVPGRQEWDVIVNRSTSQWGIESDYTEQIRDQEVGRATVPAAPTPAAVETFVITSAEAGPDAANLILEWENTRVVIPIRRV